MCFTLRLCAWQFVIEWTLQLSPESRHASIKIALPSRVPSSPSFPFCVILPEASWMFWMHVDCAIVLGTCTIKVVFGSHVRCFNNGIASVHFIKCYFSLQRLCLSPSTPSFHPLFLLSSLQLTFTHTHVFNGASQLLLHSDEWYSQRASFIATLAALRYKCLWRSYSSRIVLDNP